MGRATMVALVVSALVLTIRVLTPTPVGAPPWDAQPFDAPTNGIERVLLLHDGQAYAAIAQDPTLTDADRFYGDEAEQAYRASRPLIPWLAWLASAGRGAIVPEALFVLSIAGTGALVAAAASLAASLGRRTDQVWFILALPGVVSVMSYVGLPDALAAAGVVAGMALWTRDHRWAATIVLACAVLGRETALLGAAAIILVDRGQARRLLWTPLPYALWMAFVRVRVGDWGLSDGDPGTRYTSPLAGILKAAAHGDLTWWLAFGLTVGVVALAWRHSTGHLRCFIALWALVASCMGWHVWWKLEDFTRVLLPVSVVAAVVLLRRADETPDTIDLRDHVVTAPRPMAAAAHATATSFSAAPRR